MDGFSWDLGRIFNEQLVLDIDNAEEFTTTYHDAIWALKRISKLRRSDFEEIVREAHYPREVAKLLVEKLSRCRLLLVIGLIMLIRLRISPRGELFLIWLRALRRELFEELISL